MSGKRITSVILTILILGALLVYASTFSESVRFSSPFTFKPSKPHLTVLFAGDIMLDRNVRNKISEVGFKEFTKGIKDFVASADVSIANLEGPFTDYPSRTASLVSKELTFTFDPKLVPEMAELGFDVLGLANNHSYNFGRVGMDQTKKYLQDAGIFYYGDPDNKDSLSIVMERNGIVLGIVGFHEFTYINFDRVLAEIARIRPQVDFLIVTPHWGVEYQKEPSEFMQTWGHKFVDAGADAVIGTHPHVIGEVEEYMGKKIFYSLGNFIFDQYFSEETSVGLVIKIDLEKRDGAIQPTYVLTEVTIGKDGVGI